MPVILVIWEAEIKRIEIQGQPGHKIQEAISQKYPTQKRGEGVAHVVEYLPKSERL
jgi:hypothetical protein